MIKDKKYIFLLGIIVITYLVEDRRPDIVGDEESPVLKYKHYIDVFIFGKRKLNWTFRTKTPYDDLPFKL